MSVGIETRIGFQYEAPHLMSGKIELAVGDLVTVFDKLTNESLATGNVSFVSSKGLIISGKMNDLPPFVPNLSKHGLRAACT